MTENNIKNILEKNKDYFQVLNITASESTFPYQLISEGFDLPITYKRKMIFIAELFTLLFSARTNEIAVKIISDIIISVLKSNPNCFLDKIFSNKSNDLFSPLGKNQLIDILKKYHTFLLTRNYLLSDSKEKYCQMERYLIKMYLKKA